MKAIYASKLYKASPRKEKIRAALENPVNAELVTQLAEYLDEEYQQPQYLKGEPSTSNTHEASVKESGSDLSTEGPSGGFSGGPSTSGSPSMNMDDVVLDKDGNPMEDFEDGDDLNIEVDGELSDSADVPDDISVNDSTDDGLEDIDESTDIYKVDPGVRDTSDDDFAVEPTSQVQMDSTDGSSDDLKSKEETILENNVESIKVMLNATEETEGVERVSLKDSELWIYYNDYTNLNNIMSPVIEFFARGSFTYLEFNRLARSTNAIVFQISTDDRKL